MGLDGETHGFTHGHARKITRLTSGIGPVVNKKSVCSHYITYIFRHISGNLMDGFVSFSLAEKGLGKSLF